MYKHWYTLIMLVETLVSISYVVSLRKYLSSITHHEVETRFTYTLATPTIHGQSVKHHLNST